MTAGELKEALANVPDEYEVYISCEELAENPFGTFSGEVDTEHKCFIIDMSECTHDL